MIDGRGGGLGSRLIRRLLDVLDHQHEILALATNEAAAAAMAKAGATRVEVGEPAIRQTVPSADLILGSLSIVLSGAMLGEITPGIAGAVLQAPGRKLLLPLNRVRVEVVGTQSHTLELLIDHAIRRVQSTLRSAVLT
ncbi:MAG: DUF3842 family protein [Nitrospiraceae bacterium]